MNDAQQPVFPSTPTAAPLNIGYATPDRAGPGASRSGKGFLPAAASLYVPGLGQLIAGDPRRRAAVWFVVWLACTAASLVALSVPGLIIVLLVAVPLQFGLVITCVIDAFRRGRRSARPMLGRPVLRHVVALAFIAAWVFLHPAYPVAMFVRRHFAEAFRIPTASMSPTLLPGDQFFAHKRLAGEIRRWDVVVFDSPQQPGQSWIFRVAGLPGETVELVDSGELHVNGAPVARPPGVGPYVVNMRSHPNASPGNPLILGADEYFVLGDNSSIAHDSRYWTNPAPGHLPGVLPRDHIVGKATAIYWPLSRWRRF